MAAARRPTASAHQLVKTPTGIAGFDELTSGGVPHGRTTLVFGSAGSGKTLFAAEFLVRGALEFGEPGVLMTFEETDAELRSNVASLGFDLQDLHDRKLLVIDHVSVNRNEIAETGDYDLEPLLLRLDHAIKKVGAKRVVVDSIETLYSGLSNDGILRAELRRLFTWLKDRGVTAVVTGERSATGGLTRHGIEEYVSDCVVMLDNRVYDQISTRRLRVLKYRGTAHGTNEYPFLIDEEGISVLPITSIGLAHAASRDIVSTGVPSLDALLDRKGIFRGSTVLVSGTPGTGKTSIAASFVAAACARGERAILFAFEESPEQIVRNMASIGIDLAPWVKKGNLIIHATRPSYYGLEMHLVAMHKVLDRVKPDAVAIDPLTSLLAAGTAMDARAMMTRLIDHLKTRNVTTLATTLSSDPEEGETSISSLTDMWLQLRDTGERKDGRALRIVKARGMGHASGWHTVTFGKKGFTVARTKGAR